MNDNKTPEEIVGALKCCSRVDAQCNGCDDCPFEYCGPECDALCRSAADLIESLQAQLSETRLARNAQEAYKNHYKAQLAESQRREQAAVEDFADFIVEQGDCLRIALDTQDRHYLEQLISQWRGPQDGKGEAE